MGEAAAVPTIPSITPSPKRLPNVRAIVLPLVKKEGREADDGVPESNAQNPWESLEHSGRVITPPFEPFVLATLPEASPDLGPTIEAVETNVVGFGWQLIPSASIARLVAPDQTDKDAEERGDAAQEAMKEEILLEKERFQEFLEFGNWDDESLTACRRSQRRDYETIGYSFLELIPNATGKPVGYRHVPAYSMRLTSLDPEATTYPDSRIVGEGDRRRIEVRKKRRRFRRFVQWDTDTGSHIYFKEFGDPRVISKRTGEVLKPEDPSFKDRREHANPMLYRRLYAPRTPYGIPRHIGSLLAILGARAAEEVNYITFRNNNIPSMMILVSGGQLTSDTIERIQDFSKEVIQGDSNYSKFLILEAEGDETINQGDTTSNVRIDAKPLTSEQHTDAMFQNYEKNNSDKVRRAWRLPPIMTGGSQDYTRSTADTSRRLSEEQVFAPERVEEDWAYNRILRSMGMRFWEFKTNSPNVTDDQDLLSLLYAAEKTGAMTPRIAREIVKDILGREIPGFDTTRVPPDVAFSLTMAEAVKNEADPTEPGQQVTAMKSETVGSLLQLRDGLVRELRTKERALRSGAVPGVFLRNEEADRIAIGTKKSLTTTEKADVEGTLFALCDEVHVVGFAKFASPRKDGDKWVYDVESAEACPAFPHAGVDEGATFIGSVGIL